MKSHQQQVPDDGTDQSSQYGVGNFPDLNDLSRIGAANRSLAKERRNSPLQEFSQYRTSISLIPRQQEGQHHEDELGHYDELLTDASSTQSGHHSERHTLRPASVI